jgi:hypothetical protein
MKTLLIRGNEGIEDVVRDAVESVRANPERRKIEQKRVIAAYRRACPTVNTDEAFSVLVGLYPELFRDDDGALVRGDQGTVVMRRPVKTQKAIDEINQDAKARQQQQRALIKQYKAENPKASTDTMFTELTQAHPDVFNDPDLTPAEDAI